MVDARLLLAGLESATGDDASAEAQYEEVLKADPKNQEAYLYLGTLYAKQGKYDSSLAIFRRMIAADPTLLPGLLLRRTRGGGFAKLPIVGDLLPSGVDAQS